VLRVRLLLPLLPLLLAAADPAAAGEPGERVLTVHLGNAVTHHRDRPDHNNRPRLVGLEVRREDDWLAGAATFRNSYRQRSAYTFLGRRFEGAHGRLYGKVTGGLLVGYRGEHRDKIPLNRFGVAPAVIPSAGVQVRRYSGELVVLAASALMLNVGVTF